MLKSPGELSETLNCGPSLEVLPEVIGLSEAWHWLVKSPQIVLMLGLNGTGLNHRKPRIVGGVQETSWKPIPNILRSVKCCESKGLENTARCRLGRVSGSSGKGEGREYSHRGKSRHGGLVS